MTEILRVFEENYSVKQQYCVICFRSGLDRRMVDRKNLQDFANSINLPHIYPHDFMRVCVMCDRAAAAALRLRLAMRLSASLHSFFTFMSAANARVNVPAQLRGEKRAVDIVKHAFEWQDQLLAFRARTSLLPTEVLVLATLPLPECAESPPDESHVYVIPDDAPPTPSPAPAPAPALAPAPAPAPPPARLTVLPTHHSLVEPEIYMDPVKLEERDPIEIKPDPLSLAREAPDALQYLTLPDISTADSAASVISLEKLLNDSENSSFLLHPIVESNGAMSVPTLNAQIVNGQLMTLDKSNYVLETPKLALHNGINYNLLTEPNLVTEFLKNMNKNDFSKATIVSNNIPLSVLKNNIENNTLQLSAPRQNLATTQSLAAANNLTVTHNRTQNLVLTESMTGGRCLALAKDAATGQYLITSQGQNVTSQDMQTLMKPLSNNNILTHSIIIDDDDDDDASQTEIENVRVRQRDADSNRRKRDRDKTIEEPPKKQRETDWEDKIPMDVISYMGAVDPNADALLRDPSLGVISSVQTLSEDPLRSMPTDTDSNRDHCIAPGQTAKNSAQTTKNSGQFTKNSGQKTKNSGQTTRNNGQMVLNSVQTLNSARSRSKSATRGMDSAILGSNSVASTLGVKKVAFNNKHQNIHSTNRQQANKKTANLQADDVIDLC